MNKRRCVWLKTASGEYVNPASIMRMKVAPYKDDFVISICESVADGLWEPISSRMYKSDAQRVLDTLMDRLADEFGEDTVDVEDVVRDVEIEKLVAA